MSSVKSLMGSLVGLVIAAVLIGCSSANGGIETLPARESSGGRVVAPGGDDSLKDKGPVSDKGPDSKK